MQRTLRLSAMSVKTYANLSVPRTRWTLRVEPQQAGLTVRALLNKRLAYLGPDEVALAVEAGQVTATAAADPTGPTHPVTPEMIDDRLEYRQVLHVHIPASVPTSRSPHPGLSGRAAQQWKSANTGSL